MITKAHVWQDDGTIEFDYGLFYEIPERLIEEYKTKEKEFALIRSKIIDCMNQQNAKEFYKKILSNLKCIYCNKHSISIYHLDTILYCNNENCFANLIENVALELEYDEQNGYYIIDLCDED